MKYAALLLIALAPLSFAQGPDAKFKSAEVSPGIYMIDGVEGFVGGNVTLLVGEQSVVMIDDVLVSTIAALAETAAGIAGRPVDFVINTHVHGDHTGGNEMISGTGAIIVAHDNVRKRMLPDTDLNTGSGALPVITFSDQVTFNVNGQEAFVFHIEHAHTDGDAAILFREANVIATGDVMFHKIFPFIDLDSGGTVVGYIAGQQEIISMANDATIIIPGHGPLANKADLVADRAMLIDALAQVQGLVEKGLSEDEILAANPLAAYQHYSWSFITTERMTKTIIRSLTTD